ncbi:MAG: hypothetical protein II897_09415 [Clostridia bacterium]|nr:hypothetical protein [Clostridia bacterium]
MSLKKIVIAIISCLLLLAVGIGIEDIYCAYFHGRSGFTLFERSSFAGGGLYIVGADTVPDDTVALSRWAEGTGSALAVIGDSPGIAVCDRSGAIKKLLERAGADKSTPPLDESMSGVYVTNDKAYIGAYVENGIFMPDTLAMPVLGYYDEGRLPEDLSRPFFYPLSAMAGQGLYYLTDAEDHSGLEQLIKQASPDDEVIVQSAKIPIGRFLTLLIHDPLESRSRTSIFYTVISLSLCFIFSGLMLFREHRRELVIRHLFGMSIVRIVLTAVLISAVMIGISLSSFLFSVSAAGYVQLEREELLLLVCSVSAVYILLAAIVNTAGMIGVARSIKRGIRYEDVISGNS